MIRFVSDVLTEKNGDYDPVRLLAIIGFFTYLGLSTYEMVRHCQDFNLIEFATGMSIILGVVAGGITYKYKQESPGNT